MGKNDIVFDIETKHSFQEVGGVSNMDKLGISVLGAYFYPSSFLFDVFSGFDGTKSNFVRMLESKKNLERGGVYADGFYYAFEESEIPEFEKIIRELAHKKHSRVIGFNINHFDLPVLQPYISWSLRELPSLDLMSDVEVGAGFRVSLDNLAQNTLNAQKSGDGLEAIRWYKEGKIDEIKKYCLKDVELTKNLYEYGLKNAGVYFFNRNVMNKVLVSVNWSDKNATTRNTEQLSIF